MTSKNIKINETINTVEMINYIQKMLSEYKIVMVSEVGSHMWGMDHVDSDHDIFVVYSASTHNILRGDIICHTLPSKHHIIIEGALFDFQFMEIGHYIKLLQKANINAIWALLSHIKYIEDPVIQLLKDCIEPLKRVTAIIPSACGMIDSQMSDMIKRANVRDPTKSLRCAARTALFTYKYLEYGVWEFMPPTEPYDENDIRATQNLIRTYIHKYGHNDVPYLGEILLEHRLQNHNK